MECTVLYRPVGTEELDLIRKLHFSSFPPRLLGQPIFYPVLNMEYAIQIARDWNSKNNPDRRGYVTRFLVRTDFLKQYDVQIVGGIQHKEYWVPAEELDEFNRNIVGKIEIIAEFEDGSSK